MDVVDVGLAGDAAHRGPQRRQPMTSEELDLKSVTSSVKHLPDPSSFFSTSVKPGDTRSQNSTS